MGEILSGILTNCDRSGPTNILLELSIDPRFQPRQVEVPLSFIPATIVVGFPSLPALAVWQVFACFYVFIFACAFFVAVSVDLDRRSIRATQRPPVCF